MLYIKKPSGRYFVAGVADIIAEATAIYDENLQRGKALLNNTDAKQYIKLKLVHYEYEVFLAIFLDNKHKIIACDEMFRGTIDEARVYPREIVKAALFHNASALIFVHNHPSGIAKPSQADLDITKKLINALNLVDIRVLDHLVCGIDVYSMAEHGQI